jgi:SPP1 gp7 family putative phage head morphogenesis protein
MPSLNEQILSGVVNHSVDLQRYSNYVVKRAVGALNSVDEDLLAELTKELEKVSPSEFKINRLRTMLSGVREINGAAYQKLGAEVEGGVRSLTETELQFHDSLIIDLMPDGIQLTRIDPDQVVKAMLTNPLQGATMSQWAGRLADGRMQRIQDNVVQGYIAGETTDQIARRIRGTRANGYADGIIEVDRHHAATLARTAVNTTANQVREQWVTENSDLIKGVTWVSTLDGRTSPQCQLRDGLEWDTARKPIGGHKVKYWPGPGQLHWNCRSTSSPIVKSWKELGIDLEEVDPSTRASIDGQVPKATTYDAWLRTQSVARQDEILGKALADRFRKGESVRGFYNDQGKVLTPEELAERAKPKTKPAPKPRSAPPAPKPAPTPTPSAPTPPAPVPGPRAAAEARVRPSVGATGGPADAWHSLAWGQHAVPSFLAKHIERFQKIDVQRGSASLEASFKPGTKTIATMHINMPSIRPAGDASTLSTWRHEFGHAIDVQLRASKGGKGSYRSFNNDFIKTMNADEELLLKNGSKTMGSNDLAAKEMTYAKLGREFEETTTAAVRRQKLTQMATKAEVNLPEFEKLLETSTTIVKAEGKDTPAAHARMARMLKALELRDPEQLYREAMRFDRGITARANSEQVDRSWMNLIDMIGAVTRNRVAGFGGTDGFPGHSDDYYRRSTGGRGAEVFANLTSAAGHPNPAMWAIAKRLMPKTSKLYAKILNEEV